MRFVDLSIAGLIAATGVAALLIWNPFGPDFRARENLDQAHLRDGLLAVMQQEGLVSLIQQSPSALCNTLRTLSNSTVTFSALEGGYSCVGDPPAGVPHAELTVRVGQIVVVLESWYGAGG